MTEETKEALLAAADYVETHFCNEGKDCCVKKQLIVEGIRAMVKK